MAEELSVAIWRGDAAGGAYQDFRVPMRESQTVLDVVTWVQQNAAPDLAYRYACRVGMCGSCAMTVNGVPRWSCRTHVSKVARAGRIEIAPLRNLPVIRDLATDMDPFFDSWTRAGGVHRPSRTRSDPVQKVDPQSRARRAADAGIECINCAVCYAACDTVSASPGYLGPAALQRAWTVINDEKHADRPGVLAAAAGEGGCQNCHSMGSCAELCPKGLDPMAAIAGLKRASLKAAFGRKI